MCSTACSCSSFSGRVWLGPVHTCPCASSTTGLGPTQSCSNSSSGRGRHSADALDVSTRGPPAARVLTSPMDRWQFRRRLVCLGKLSSSILGMLPAAWKGGSRRSDHPCCAAHSRWPCTGTCLPMRMHLYRYMPFRTCAPALVLACPYTFTCNGTCMSVRMHLCWYSWQDLEVDIGENHSRKGKAWGA